MSETTVIKNGRIIDGSGRPGFIGDIAIKDGKIIAIEATAILWNQESVP